MYVIIQTSFKSNHSRQEDTSLKILLTQKIIQEF